MSRMRGKRASPVLRGAGRSNAPGLPGESLRLAPSMTAPIGIPNRSVAIERFQPILARSVGLGPVPSPPQGALCRLASTATSDRSRPMILS